MSKTFIKIITVNGSEIFVNVEKVRVFSVLDDVAWLCYSAQEGDYDCFCTIDYQLGYTRGIEISREELEKLKAKIREFVEGV